MQKILEKIKSCQNGMNVSEFARFIGQKQQTVYCYLSGERKISLDFVYCVCEKCGVSADWLLGLSPQRVSRQSINTQATQPGRGEEQVCELERKNALLKQELANAKHDLALARARMEGLEFALKAIGTNLPGEQKDGAWLKTSAYARLLETMRSESRIANESVGKLVPRFDMTTEYLQLLKMLGMPNRKSDVKAGRKEESKRGDE